MAELRSSTSIGGNLVWHSGNLRFATQGETIRYSGFKIYTEHDTPLPSELGNGGTTSAFNKTESDARFAPIHSAGYVRKDGDKMSGKLTTTGNDIEISGSSPRLTLTEGSAKWFVIVDGTDFSIRQGTTSTQRLILDSGKMNVLTNTFQLQSKTALRATDTSWLRINDQGSFTSGTYFGTSLIRTDGSLQVGSSSTVGLSVNTTRMNYKGSEVFYAGDYTTLDGRYVNNTGDTITGRLTMDGSNKTGGIKFDDVLLRASSTVLTMTGGKGEFRFSDDTGWFYGNWGGIRYVHASGNLFIGGSQGNAFESSGTTKPANIYMDKTSSGVDKVVATKYSLDDQAGFVYDTSTDSIDVVFD